MSTNLSKNDLNEEEVVLVNNFRLEKSQKEQSKQIAQGRDLLRKLLDPKSAQESAVHIIAYDTMVNVKEEIIQYIEYKTKLQNLDPVVTARLMHAANDLLHRVVQEQELRNLF